MTLTPIPFSAAVFVRDVLGPALGLLPQHMDTAAARVLITAICLQESAFDAPHGSRWQVIYVENEDPETKLKRKVKDKGAARGLAQFERGGGCTEVCHGRASAELTRLVCRARDVRLDPRDIWAALDDDDLLAVALARLLLWGDPARLPAPCLASAAEGFAYYLRNWRPGAWTRGGAKDREGLRNKWHTAWAKALAANGVPA